MASCRAKITILVEMVDCLGILPPPGVVGEMGKSKLLLLERRDTESRDHRPRFWAAEAAYTTDTGYTIWRRGDQSVRALGQFKNDELINLQKAPGSDSEVYSFRSGGPPMTFQSWSGYTSCFLRSRLNGLKRLTG